MRNFITLSVKKLLLVAIVMLSKRYPTLTEESVWHPNARLLFNNLKKFREYETNQMRKGLFEALFRIGINEYQAHTFYRNRCDFLVEGLKGWLPRSTLPISFWKELRETEGTLFPTEKLSEIMRAKELERSVLIQDLLISAGEGRIYATSPSGCSEGSKK